MENSSYHQQIEALRNERLKTREAFFEITKTAERVMNVLRGVSTEFMVTIEELKEFKIGQLIKLSSKVSFVKYYEDHLEMRFTTYLEPGGRYGIHKHNCEEITRVVSGHLIELLDDNKIYACGQRVVYKKDILHEPYCTIKSEYDVTFKFN